MRNEQENPGKPVPEVPYPGSNERAHERLHERGYFDCSIAPIADKGTDAPAIPLRVVGEVKISGDKQAQQRARCTRGSGGTVAQRGICHDIEW